MKEITLLATDENLSKALSFVISELEAMECSMKVTMQMEVVIEELFVNISHYAYGDKTGDAHMIFDTENDGKTVVVTFIDSGMPYNPVAKEDPDTTLSADERQIGGLGIFLVKKNTDEMTYEYKDGHNVLTIKKNI